MELVIEVIRPVVQSLLVPVKEGLGFVVSWSNYATKTRTRMIQLDSIAADVKTHMETNNANNLEIPHRFPDWLEDVKRTKTKIESIPIGGIGCFNVMIRYRVGKRSCELLEEVERLIKEASEIKWTNQQKPLGRVDSKEESTSTPFDDGGESNKFDSRGMIRKDALKSLQPNAKTQKIALCGMGGVGKTMMMQLLKNDVEDLKTFDWVVKVVIGQNPNPIVVQQAVSEQLGEPLTETIKDTRAERLQKRFKSISEDGKKKILVILDDVWEKVVLEDIGLPCPLPNGFKLLLTTRDRRVCTEMSVEANSVFNINVLNDIEAKILFDEISGISIDGDPVLHDIGKDIVKRCGGLPIAIKIIASTLRDNYVKDAWEDARSRLHHNGSHVLSQIVYEVFEISYNNLKEEDDKAIFLLSGLFPDDFNIPMEELTRYAWGLKLLSKVYSLAEARRRVNTCVGKLIRANLLMESDHVGCIKMHDLVRAFVLSNFSKVKQASVVNHGDKSQWPPEDTSKSYERFLIKCTRMSEVPVDFNYPNLKLLKIMDGDVRLKFPKDFFQTMKSLEVVAYEKINASLLPVRPQYSTKLRTLCLHSCSLMDDFSFLGDLVNLEILSFAHCGIRKLPSTMGKLKKLMLLDLTGCYYHLCFDDGVFRSLVNLEELYMTVPITESTVYKRTKYRKYLTFTDANCEELEEMLSRELCALEFEFFENKIQPKNVSFTNLERFKISMGCLFVDSDFKYWFNNTLKLETNRSELLECKINNLFNKTENLYLQVKDMISLEDVTPSMESCEHSFCNLVVLEVYDCPDLKNLCTIPVASGLRKLERLTISHCSLLEALVHDESSVDGTGTRRLIKFQKLKFLRLYNLPKFVSFSDKDNVVEFPHLGELELSSLQNFTCIYPPENITSAMQPFLNKQIVIPKLEKLKIWGMDKLKQIWPCQDTSNEGLKISTLRHIQVEYCDNLVNLFPSNPLRLLCQLEKLEVKNCHSIEVLFNIDLSCVAEVEEEASSRLRSIHVNTLRDLREVWRINGANNSCRHHITTYQAIERIHIGNCRKFRHVWEPTTLNFDLGALMDLSIYTSFASNDTVLLPSNLIHNFKNLRNLYLEIGEYRYHMDFPVEVVFEIESHTDETQQSPLLPCLEKLEIRKLDGMRHVWKCNWNQFLIRDKHQPKSSFHNLTTIKMYTCGSIKYLFSPLMAKLLSNLNEVDMRSCYGIE